MVDINGFIFLNTFSTVLLRVKKHVKDTMWVFKNHLKTSLSQIKYVALTDVAI